MINKVIVNADDFGMCEGVYLGILSAHKNGIVTSTTCMMNMPYAQVALEEAKKFPKLGVGVHLVLTLGKPLTKTYSFVDENGHFIKINRQPELAAKVNKDELYIEWKAQIEKYIEITGKKPTHLDSHHHVHMLPELIQTAIQLAKEYDVPMRQVENVYDTYEFVPCEKDFYDEQVTVEYLKEVMEKYENVVEIMCHPALVDQWLYDSSRYSLKRMKESDVLSCQDIKEYIENNHIELINYSDLEKNK